MATLKKLINQLWQRISAQGGVVPERIAPLAEGRVYEVPEGLLPRFFELYVDLCKAERIGRGAAEAYRMWRLLKQRCPEINEGHWKVVVHGWTRVEVIEVLPWMAAPITETQRLD